MPDASRLVLTALVCAWAGCDGARPVAAGDGGARQDSVLTSPEAGVAGPDLGPAPKQYTLDFVMDRVLMPTSNKAHARDLDGDGVKENKIGEFIAMLDQVAGLKMLQKNFDAAVTGGRALTLLRIHTDSLPDDSSARLHVWRGVDLDSIAADNFSGSEPLGLHKSSPKHPASSGKLAGGVISMGPARLTLLFPLVEKEPSLALQMTAARVEGSLEKKGTRISGGNLAGVIAGKEMDSKFLPALMRWMCHETFKAWGKTGPSPICITYSLSPCTLEQCLKVVPKQPPSALIKTFFTPDLDMDLDGKKESYSIGLGFTAVSCVIKD